MKKLSNPMGVMWETDSNKSLWSLMTKAWSVIHDQIGKDKAPLDQFFRIICPYLNIPSPENYLENCGWILNTDEEGTPTLSREFAPSPGTSSVGIADMAISVEDIINYCQSMGYAQEYTSEVDIISPALLAQSCSQFAGKSTSVKSHAQVTGSTHEGRLEARNKRRAKRQIARDIGLIPELQKQIVNAHVAGDMNVTYQDSTLISRSKPMQFYDGLADPLTNHMEHHRQVNPGITAGITTAEDLMLTPWTDWNAFRLSGHDNATLPSFDPALI